jgi:hypothetical protein
VEEHWSLITFNTISETLIPIASKKSGWVFAYFFDQGCAMHAYKEAVKLAKEYALSARLAFTKQGAAEAWAMAKKYQDEAAKLMVAASRTSALYRHYSKETSAAPLRDKPPPHCVPFGQNECPREVGVRPGAPLKKTLGGEAKRSPHYTDNA